MGWTWLSGSQEITACIVFEQDGVGRVAGLNCRIARRVCLGDEDVYTWDADTSATVIREAGQSLRLLREQSIPNRRTDTTSGPRRGRCAPAALHPPAKKRNNAEPSLLISCLLQPCGDDQGSHVNLSSTTDTNHRWPRVVTCVSSAPTSVWLGMPVWGDLEATLKGLREWGSQSYSFE